VLAFERAMEAAVVRGDVAYVDRVSAPDLTFTHGDGWTARESLLRLRLVEQRTLEESCGRDAARRDFPNTHEKVTTAVRESMKDIR